VYAYKTIGPITKSFHARAGIIDSSLDDF
jgi:hypothetical protein